MKSNVIEKVVKKNLCIGCGVCAGVCPAKALKMEFNKHGEYNPIISSNCLEKCDLCLDICPFHDQGKNEDSLSRASFGSVDGIKHQSETGYYLNTYVGYSNVDDLRTNGASGGMGTWLLEAMLQKKIVDRVICVTPNNDADKLFRFAIFDDIESVRHSSGSAYYPVEMSEIIREILKKEGRYAITGQPCFLKGLRLGAKSIKRLRERIVITVGLVCGQMKSKYYTTYLASLSGIKGRLKKVNYRGKSPQKPASNYFFHCIDGRNSEGKLFWDEGVSEAWVNRWFTPASCNFCDDVFAELADVTVMDAWLPEYSRDSRGTNLLISRSLIISNLLEAGRKEKQISIQDISIGKVVQAQSGVLNIKRNQLAYRLYRAKQSGLHSPAKRVAPSRNIGYLMKKEIELKDKMQTISKSMFLAYYDNDHLEVKAFSEELNPFVNELRKWNRIGYILHLPIRAIRKAKSILLGL